MRSLTLVLSIIMLPLLVSAIPANAGEFGFQFLQVPANPIASALAGNGIYGNNYSGAFILNPAANLMDETSNVSVNHNLWLVDTSCTQIIYSRGNRNKHFGFSARFLDYGQINTRNDMGRVIGNYHPLDTNLMTNFAWRILPDHMIGVNAGLIYEKLESASSFGITSDVGYMFLPPITNSNLFVSVRNIGITSKMENESVKLPITLETGFGYIIPDESFRLSQQVAVSKAVDTDYRFTYSAEMALWEILALRLGYKFNYDEEDLTAGLGINLYGININYGWMSFSDRLNDTHSVGLTYNF
jgi:hypothetical protein